MATYLILPNCESPDPRPPDSGAMDPADQYVDLLLEYPVTPCPGEVGGADHPPVLVAPAYQECTDCNGLDTDFLDQFTDLDKIFNTDMSQQTLSCLGSPDSEEGDTFLLDTTTSCSTSSIAWTSDQDTPLCLCGPFAADVPTFPLGDDQLLTALLCENMGTVTPPITPTTPPITLTTPTTPPITPIAPPITPTTPITLTTPPTTPTTTSTASSPLSILYNKLSPHKTLPSDDQEIHIPAAKRLCNSPSDGAGKKSAKYTERRQKNNEASKVSRRKRKERYQDLLGREERLREENARLRRQVEEMVNETSMLKALLVTRLAGQC